MQNELVSNNLADLDDQEDIFEDALDSKSEDGCKNNLPENEIIKPEKDQMLKKKLQESKLDNLENQLKKIKVYTIEDGIDNCIKSAFELNSFFLNNQLDLVIKFGEKNYNKNIFYSLIYSAVCWLKSWMSFEQPEIHNCLEVLNICSEYVNTRRRPSLWSEFIKKINYNSFTDEEAHAEIIYSELQFLIGTVTFIKNQSFSSLIKGAYKFRCGYQSFNNCGNIFHNREKWSSEISKKEFHSFLLSGSGVFNLSLSNAPPKILAILEFVGFTCNERTAIKNLTASIYSEKTIKSTFSMLVLLSHYTYFQFTLGWGFNDQEKIGDLVDKFKDKYPTSFFAKYFVGKNLQIIGELEKSNQLFNELLDSIKCFPQMNNACYWELFWINAMQNNWKECIRISDFMRKNSLWSPCIFTYLYAISLLMIEKKNQTNKLKPEIDECLRQVPNLRRRLAGKSTPIEKLAISKSEYYFNNSEELVLPIHEIMFYYNLINIYKNDKIIMENNLTLIDNELKVFDENEAFKLNKTNDYCICLMVKSTYLRLMNFPLLAAELLEKILTYSKYVTESHLIPFATIELAFCYLQLNQITFAKKLLKTSLNHKKFTAELILQFRAYYALKYIKTKNVTNERK